MLLAAVSGCSAGLPASAAADAHVSPDGVTYPEIDPALGERLFADEAAISREISAAIEKSLRHQYDPGGARRDAHPKAHGCVRAEFQVKEELPANLAKGMFVPGKTYQAWIRFSNGSRDSTRADIKKDARGMAMKVLSVPGKKLVEDEDQTGAQDFILINHPVFFANDPKRYLALARHQGSDNFFGKLLIPFDLGAKGSLIAVKTVSKKISNPLQTRYWSMVPYQLGTDADRQAVKYSARSCTADVDPTPAEPGHDFLRDALRSTLQKGDACMEFLVQPRTSESMDVEDSMTEWQESEAPFYPVATLRIPLQVFDTAAQNAFCENLSFTPWHALPEHRPLGVTNRLRKGIYEHISRVRHAMNSTQGQGSR